MSVTSGTTPAHLLMKYTSSVTLEELRNPDTWDLGNAVTQPPIKNRRSVVSVAFPSADFQTVAREARRLGKKVSAFIREAALGAAKP